MNTKQKNAAWTVVAAALCAAFAAGVQAEEVLQVHVKYADLNVNDPAGAVVLYQRIRSAAGKVCSMPGSRELDLSAKVEACKAKATAAAVAAVNVPALTAVSQIRVGASVNTQLASIR